MTYRKYITKTGIKYSKNHRFIKVDKIPPKVLALLETNNEVEDDGKYCRICGIDAKIQRLVNSQPIVLCSEHYYSLNMGKLVQHLREYSNG